jgi:hypothetical protein
MGHGMPTQADQNPTAAEYPKMAHAVHSALSVFGATPEQLQASTLEAHEHPIRSALLDATPGASMLLQAPHAIATNARKSMDEDRAATEALKRGDIKGYLAHQVGSAGYTGATALAPVFGESPATAGEQLGSGDVSGAAGTTAGILAPFGAARLMPEARSGALPPPNVWTGEVPAEIPAGRPTGQPNLIHRASSALSKAGNPDVVGLASPRLAHLQRLSGKLADITAPKPTSDLPIQSASRGEVRGPYQPYQGDLKVNPSGDTDVIAPPETKPAPYRMRGNQIQDAATITPRQVFKPKGLLGTGQPTEAAIPPVKAQPKGEVPVQSTWPPERPSAIQPLKFGGAQDRLETKGIQEQMREDLEGHGRQALSQEKRDWFARNVPGETKGTLTANARAQKTIATRPNGEVPVEGKPFTPAVEERGIKAPQKRTFERSTDQGIKDYFSYRFDQLRAELKSAQTAGNQTAISDVQRRMNELDSIQRNPGQMKATLTGEVPAEPPTTNGNYIDESLDSKRNATIGRMPAEKGAGSKPSATPQGQQAVSKINPSDIEAERFVRYGKPPSSGTSTNAMDRQALPGVSVYRQIKVNGQWINDSSGVGFETLGLKSSGKPLYEVSGDLLPQKGPAGEPLLRNAKVKGQIQGHVADLPDSMVSVGGNGATGKLYFDRLTGEYRLNDSIVNHQLGYEPRETSLAKLADQIKNMDYSGNGPKIWKVYEDQLKAKGLLGTTSLTGEVPAEPPTTDWSVENMKKQIEKNKKTRTAKAGD